METLLALAAGGIGGIVLLSVIAVVATYFLYICEPNELIVFSGRKRTLPDGTTVGYRVLTGGRAQRWPILEKAERMDARWRLTQLLRDLTHAAPPEIPALGAQCHAELGRAVLDSSGSWRAERKFLRTAVARVAPAVAECLDEGLRLACQGDPNSLLELGREILGALGGELRTYSERY